jgi:hypothetical protein
MVSATGLVRGWATPLRIASRDECPAAHVFPADIPRLRAGCERTRRRDEGARSAAQSRRARMSARSPARRLGRSDREFVRHAVLLSSCRAALDARARASTTLRVAGCREGKGIRPSDSSADSPAECLPVRVLLRRRVRAECLRQRIRESAHSTRGARTDPAGRNAQGGDHFSVHGARHGVFCAVSVCDRSGLRLRPNMHRWALVQRATRYYR